ncbi:MAG: hypothetical protein NTW09_06130 [Candidatus Omnitrophica bacterium]|nr:hypothetical protein [Candidatus Omnitrophota bacterium]
MKKDELTPEEKLLKIIENPGMVEKKKALPITRNIDALRSWFATFDIKAIIPKRVDIKTVNKVLAVLCILATLFLISDLLNGRVVFKRKLNKILAGTAVSAVAGRTTIPDVKPEDLIAGTKKRNIFTLEAEKAKPISRSDIAGAAVELKLVGILWSENPQAMVEDTKAQKTYLVSAGDKIGTVNVKSILIDKVVLSKDTEEWDLR